MDVEWDPAEEQFIGENADTPNIHFAVIKVRADHFWRKVERSAALGAPQEGRVYCPSKIANFGSAFMEKDVLGLDVAVNDVIGVHEIECSACFLDCVGHFPLPQLRCLNAFEEVAAQARLQQQIHVFLIVGIAIDSHDVGMSEVGLDFNLLHNLRFDLRRESLLGDDLEAADEVGADVLHQIHLAVASLVDELDLLEDLRLAVNVEPPIAAILVSALRGCAGSHTLGFRGTGEVHLIGFIMNFLEIFVIGLKLPNRLFSIPGLLLRGVLP